MPQAPRQSQVSSVSMLTPINWSFGVSSATGSTTESVPPLVLTDFIQPANTELICGALLVASGTTNYYADSDRGGSDSPLDGELGLSDTETVISRIRRHSASELNLNDNDSPSRSWRLVTISH